MKYRHYAPKADLVIVEGSAEPVSAKINELAADKIAHGLKTGVICTEETKDRYRCDYIEVVGSRADEDSIARNLFAVLRDFDDLGVDCIYSESFDGPGLGRAIMNRLLKAAAMQVIHINRKGDSRINRILFVSQGATITGPMAEGVAKKLLEGKEIEISCKGLVVLFPEPMNQKAEAVMIGNGIRMDGYLSSPLTAEDMGDATLVLTVDEKRKQTVMDMYPQQKMVYTLSEYAGMEEMFNPYGGELADYGKCYEQLRTMIEKMVMRLGKEGLI